MKKILISIIINIFLLTTIICQEKEIWRDPYAPIDERVKDLISRLTLEEKISQMMHSAPAIERLGIPEYNWWNEALHGVARAGKATVFPQAIALAATFDEDLVYRIATAISTEGRAKFNAAVKLNNRKQYMGLTYWTPNINIFRDPRWGRGQETYGEDPYLTSRMGVAFVKGLQGDDPKYLKTAACAKHYVVHSGPEGLRHEFNALPPKKDFFETYLPAFEALVKEANVEAVMCAYNRTYNQPCCGSTYLLNDILRKKWNFKGHIVTDCGALKDFYDGHNIVKDEVQAAALAIKSGINLECGTVFKNLNKAVEKGLISEKDIDEQLFYLLKTRFKLGLFDPQELVPYNNIDESKLHCQEHINLAYEAAAKSIVLLKNNGILPLSKDLKDIQIVGVHGNDVQFMYGNYYGLSPNVISISEGIVSKVNPGTRVNFRQGVMLERETLNPINYALGVTRDADVVIAVLGISCLIEGEEGDPLASSNKGDRLDIKLPDNQIKFLKDLKSRGKSPIVLIVTGGSPISLVEVEDLVDAILFIWYPGEQGGNAVADILFGDVNPSGKLPVTFPKSVDQLPPFDDYSMENRTYRYMKDEPEFPFGFGLSYTKFEYSDIKLSSKKIRAKDTLYVECKVTNIGTKKGDEVVQLYLSDLEASCRVPLYSLKGFKRITLEPGETKIVKFKISPDMLKLIKDDGSEVIEPGYFRVFIGGSSPSEVSIKRGLSKPVSDIFYVRK